MEITLILQVITIGITILTIFADYFYNLKINQKTRTFGLIGQEMVDNLEIFRNNYAKIIELADPTSIKTYNNYNKDTNWYNYSYARELNFARAKIRTITFPFWDKEKHLHDTLDQLCKASLRYYERPNREDAKIISKLRDDFFIECSIYDWAMWEYCQEQISGDKVSRENLEEHYFSVLTRIQNSGSGHSERFKSAFEKIYDNFTKQKTKIKFNQVKIARNKKKKVGNKK